MHRSDWGRLLATLVVRTRRLDLAEDALAEAFARAAERWPSDGVPANPAAWMYTVASRIVIGRLRAEAVAGKHAPLLAVRSDAPASTIGATIDGERGALPDDRLQLVLLCCHPALDPAARSALALRMVVGTTTAEIARLFNVPTPTMAARLTRAKRKIAAAGIPLSLPAGDELMTRLDAVCLTVYLAFTAGYAPGSGPGLLRTDLAGEAVELADVLHRLVPAAPQAQALLALLLFQHSRRDARVRDGELITLPEQDRTTWRHDEIERAERLLWSVAPTAGYTEELRLQAAIAREHCLAKVAATTNWSAIADLYADLERQTGSPIVRVNRAVAVAEVNGPAVGLAMLDELGDTLAASHRFHATRADLARRAGDIAAADAAYRRAIELCGNDVERAFLTARLDALTTGSTGR